MNGDNYIITLTAVSCLHRMVICTVIKHPLMFGSSTHICIMIRQMVICTVDQTGGDLLNDQTYFDIEIYRWEHLELKLKSKLK